MRLVIRASTVTMCSACTRTWLPHPVPTSARRCNARTSSLSDRHARNTHAPITLKQAHGTGMGFKQLLTKVQQAEAALETRERLVADDWRQLKRTWKETWTPARVIIAGLVSGLLVGRAQALRTVARSGQFMQLVTMLSGLFAGGTAKVAAEEAEHAADTAETVAEVVAPEVIAPEVMAPGAVAPQDVSTTTTGR